MGITYSEDDQDLTAMITSISRSLDVNFHRDTFNSFLPLIPLNMYSGSPLQEIFINFNETQIYNFSNNLISFMNFQLTDKLELLNYSAELALCFTIFIHHKYKTLRDLSPEIYKKIKEANDKKIEVLKTNFPYNILIFCINVLNNDEFLFRKDIFQREYDKFEFQRRITNIIFFIINNRDFPIKKNCLSSIEYIDTIKLFLFNRIKENNLITVEIQDHFINKLYNTSIYNFDNLLSCRVDPNIQSDFFESFLFMNFYLLDNFFLDNNRILYSEEYALKKKEKKAFNISTSEIFGILFNVEEKNIKDYIEKYNTGTINYIHKIIYDKINEFKKFILNFYNSINKLTISFKIIVKIFIILVIESYNDICEELCLSADIINLIYSNLSFNNAYDLIILYLLSQSHNFHITFKHLNLDIEDLSTNSLENIIENRTASTSQLTYSALFSLLVIKSFSIYCKAIDDKYIKKIIELFDCFVNYNITNESFFDNLICFNFLNGIICNLIKHLDKNSELILELLKNKSKYEECYNKFNTFYLNNFGNNSKGKEIYEKYNNSCNFLIQMFEKMMEDINKHNFDINKIKGDDILDIIINNIDKENEIFNSGHVQKIIGGNIESFMISTLHSFTEFRILS